MRSAVRWRFRTLKTASPFATWSGARSRCLGSPSCALLDVPLGGNVVDLYQWTAAHRPDLAQRVAFVAGSSDAEVCAPPAALGCPIVRKPFDLDDLRRLATEWEVPADPNRRQR